MREYKKQTNVSGLSVKDVLSKQPGELETMSDSDLRRLVGRLVSAGNKRLRTFEKRGEKSPAYNSAMYSGGKFSTKGKDKNALILEFMRAKIFFSSESSTVKNWKKIKSEVVNKIHPDLKIVDTEGVYDDISAGDYENYDYSNGRNDFSKDVWRMVDRIHQINPVVANKNNKYRIAGKIADMAVENPRILRNEQYLFGVYQALLESEQERAEVNYEFDNGVSKFFK